MEITNYHEQQHIKNITKMREVLDTLPGFCKQYFRGIENVTSARTRLGYALDLRIFFEFLQEKNSALKGKEIKEYKLSILDQLSREDIEEYLDYLSYYEKEGKFYTNDERGKSRKLASLRSFYHYYFTSSDACDYVLNTNTKKFHYTYCSSVKRMSEKNTSYYTGTREDVINMGYDPCGNCNP